MLVALVVVACVGVTPAQRYYEVASEWNATQQAAFQWMMSPSGRAHPEIARRIVGISERVDGVLTEVDVLMCSIGNPTPANPAPPPDPGCIPLSDSGAQSKYKIAAQLTAAATAELRQVLLEQGQEVSR